MTKQKDKKFLDFLIKLNPKQEKVYREAYLNPNKRYLLLYGASRSGKTFLSFAHKMQLCVEYPGIKCVFIRKTFADLNFSLINQTFRDYKNYVRDRYFKKYPEERLKYENKKTDILDEYFTYNKTTHTINWKNGSVVSFFGASTNSTGGGADTKIIGSQFETITCDEAKDIDYKTVIETLFSRLNFQRGKLFSVITGKEFSCPKLEFLENPTTKSSWTYIFGIEKKNPISGVSFSEEWKKKIYVGVFTKYDNQENLDPDYYRNMEELASERTIKTYVDAVYSDADDYAIFPKLNWEYSENWSLMERICIYVDPSYKSGVKNDFKAVVTVGVRRGVFYVLNVMAEQCTTDVMVHLLYQSWVTVLKGTRTKHGIFVPVELWVENAGLPDDFNKAIEDYNRKNNCQIPYELDRSKKGNKYDRIESELVPLNKSGRLIFNLAIESMPQYKILLETQFLGFKKNADKNAHDDIPDAIQGAIAKLRIKIPNFEENDFSSVKNEYKQHKY